MCFGEAVEDCAGVCEGNAQEDCIGECDGSAIVDDCGSKRNGNNADQDCNGGVW